MIEELREKKVQSHSKNKSKWAKLHFSIKKKGGKQRIPKFRNGSA